MAKYSYKARDRHGGLVKGELEAGERREAQKILMQRRLVPIDVELFEGSRLNLDGLPTMPTLSLDRFFKRKASIEDLMFFFQQLQIIYAVGIPLLRGLELIHDQCEHAGLKEALKTISRDVNDGRSLADSLESFPRYFDSVTVNLLRAGEASGRLEEMLERIAQLLQQRLEQKAKVSAATFYPKIVLTMIFVVFMAVVYFVIPKFEAFFGKFGGELPWITRMMMGLSQTMTSYWWAFLMVGIALVTGFRMFVRHPDGRKIWDRAVLATPVFGPVLLMNDLLSFCSVFAMLIRSGVPIAEALPVIKGAMANTLVQDDIESFKLGVESGSSMSESLVKTRYIPKTVTSLIGIGEEAGALEKTLLSLAQYYRTRLDYKLGNLSKAIEPVLLIFVFGMVLVLALSVFLPMWKMNSLLKR